MKRRLVAVAGVFALVGIWGGCQGLVKGVNTLTVNVTGPGAGTVTSSPAGINCPGTCTADFHGAAQVVLSAQPDPSFGFGGWTGNCTPSNSACNVTFSGSNVTADFTASLQSVNHIIFMAQENRSFDSYFGAMRGYWAQNGIPDQPFDGLPQFNPAGDPKAGPPPSNPGCDPAFPSPANLFAR